MDPAPSFKVHPKSSQFSSFFAISVGCKRKNLPELPYEYCFTYESIIDFDADVSVNDQIKLLVHINNLNIQIIKVLESARGTIGYTIINFALWGILGSIALVINTFLASGFDLNWIISDILGINFFYFKKFLLEEGEQFIYARITPGFRIWPNQTINHKLADTPYDLTAFGQLISEMGLPESSSAQGIEKFIDEKINRALDL